MQVEVKLYSLLRQHHPGPDRSTWLRVELPDGATVQDLAAQLQLPARLVTNAFVNEVHRPLVTPLHDGDRIGLFPQVSGGQAAMRVFIAGIMQGSRRDTGMGDQSYRLHIAEALRTHLPDVEVVDPLML